jgi:hypothetical protein
MGVLSALPIIQVANACCCLWVVTGGLVAAYLLQQEQSTPLTPGDGAMVGLLAGLAGAVISTLISIPIDLVMGPISRAFFEQMLSNNDLPPNLRDMIENMGQADRGFGAFLFFRAAAFVMFLMVGGFFSTLGGLLGSVLFSRKAPLPPAPDARFS